MGIALLAKVGGGLACLTGATVGGCYAAGLIGGQDGNGTSEQTDVEPKNANGGTQQIQTRETQVHSRGGNANAKQSKPSTWKRKSTTTWDPLEVEKDGYEAQTLGKMYGRYLLGIYGNDENKELQKTQWQELYKRAARNDEEDDDDEAKFGESAFVKEYSKGVTTHYAEKEGDMRGSLNGMCEELYKKTFEQLKQQSARENDENKIKNDLFGYCSTISSAPSIIDSSNKDSYGGEQGVISELLDYGVVVTNDQTYYPFWYLQDRWFKALNDEITDPLFKEHQEKKSTDNLDVMRACDAAYKIDKNSENRPLREDVVKYCSFPKVS